MRRPILVIAALAVVAASCSDGPDVAAPSEEPSSTTTVVQAESDVSTTASTVPNSTLPESEAPQDTAAPVDGPAAPDFTVTLDDGTEFTLSEEQKPVYLVFWAEW